jgi:hypothetical protein
MATKKIVLSDVFKKDLRLFGFLIVSGVLGYVLAKYVADDPMLTVVIGPAINYVLYRIEQEKKNEGYREALKG